MNMFLKDEDLKDVLIEGAQDVGFGNISCDLFIKEILANSGHVSEYALKSGESVFVSTVEVIDVPKNMFAQVIMRNSAIRLGLDIAAPVYQPGHKTRIFFRVTNVSSATVNLKQGLSVCSLMLYRFSTDSSKPYAGVYSDEFDYRGIGDFHSVAIPAVGEIEEKLRTLEKLEARLYGNVMMMLTVFVAIFSLVNLNSAVWQSNYTLQQAIAFNFMFLSIISALVLLVAEILNRLKSRRWLFCVPVLSLAVSLLVR